MGGQPRASEIGDPPSTSKLKPLRALGRWLVGLLLAAAIVDVAVALGALDSLDILGRLRGGVDVSFEEMQANDVFVGVTTSLKALLLMVVAGVWLVWFRRAYTNIPRLSDGAMRWRSGWALGAWFVPVLNFVMPKAMVNDVWRAGDPVPRREVPFHRRRVPWLLHAWWLLWIVFSTLDTTAFHLLSNAETVADQHSAATVQLTSSAANAAIDVGALLVVLQLTRRHDRRRDVVLADAPVSAPGGVAVATA